MKVLFIGDVFGDPGVKTVGSYLFKLRGLTRVDFCVANAENAASRGAGLSASAAGALFAAGVDAITLGNHTWNDRDIFMLFKEGDRVIRPANYPEGVPGKGCALYQTPFGDVGVINLLGRLYMEACESPFTTADIEIAKLKETTNIIIIDIHAEATSEKRALACCVDGRCSLVAGTHTHVQTADEQILPGGSAFITDVGMTGPADRVIGVKSDSAIRRFRTMIPERYVPAGGRTQINAVIVEIDIKSGKSISINRVNSYLDEIAP